MLSVVLTFLALQGPAIERDAFGVPQILAPTFEEGFYHFGYAVAEDRMWQMETSRRLARGKMAEVFGKAMADSDREYLKIGYTDDELQAQLDKLSPSARTAYREYAKGVNAYFEAAKAANKLPKGYAENGFAPEPWTELDSAAITIRLFQLFGRGGAGEVRNLALLTYLQNQSVKDRALDVIDDFIWFQDPASPTTVRPEDDAGGNAGNFPLPTRRETQDHLAALPKYTLFDLLPGLRLIHYEDSDMLAQTLGAPFKSGSYAIVVGKDRSATGRPLLLGAPQMGFTMPSIVHEASISCPGYRAAGMDVPGVPGIAIGHSDAAAWTMTSGIADTDDVYSFADEGSSYRFGKELKPFELTIRPLKIKGEVDQRVERKRTMWGPVVASSTTAKAVLARRSSYWGREMESVQTLFEVASARNAEEIERAADKATMSFNFFYATKDGDIGYRYLGLVPKRKKGYDPRFPPVASPETDWDGFIPSAQMPRVRNPKNGLLTNWNNKPVAWWPNGDTPAWGRVFRVDALNRALPDGKLRTSDLEKAAWTIARTEAITPDFMRQFQAGLLARSDLSAIEADALSYLLAFDGWLLEGSASASIFSQSIIALREELFTRHVGTLLAPDTFRQAIQPSLMLNALEGKTKFDYLAGRNSGEVVLAAFRKALERMGTRGSDPALWGFRPGVMTYEGEPPVPYADRGTFIQIVEARPTMRGRNVLPPGTAESGEHAKDQIALARAWLFKAMRIR